MKRNLVKILVILISITVISILYYMKDNHKENILHFYQYMYFFPIIFTAVYYGFRGGILTALIVSIIYSPQKLLQIGLHPDAVNELLEVGLYFVIGVTTGLLVEKKNIAVITINNQLKKYMILDSYTNSIFESINAGIITINNDYYITSVNLAAKKLLGTSADCIGLPFMEVLSCCKEVEADLLNAIHKKEQLYNQEKTLIRDNEEINIRISTYPLNYEDKNKGLVMIIEDITELRKIKSEMQRNDKLASIGQLSAGIAHEIRNPLAIIKMIANTMQKEIGNNQELRQELQVIDEEVERANSVIKSLLKFSKTNKPEKKMESVNQILYDVLVIVNQYLYQHSITVNFAENEIPTILCDKNQLIQAFINLILNAIDAMPQGGSIDITTINKGKSIIINMRDSGIGIDETIIEKIFDPFFTTKEEGTGLGLAIVYRIIEEHEGSITVTSKPGQGTCFEIKLPVT